MKHEKLTYRIGVALLALLTAVVMLSCSDDSEQDGKSLVTVEVIPSSQSFVDVERMSFTRGGIWNPPTGYVFYSELNSMFADQTDLVDNTIDIFFTRNEAFTDDETPKNYIQGLFTHGSDGTWRSSVRIVSGDTYYLYGFIPYISSVSASIAPNAAYSEGAVLTLQGLPTVTPNDVCVIVGAKNGKADYKQSGEYTVSGLAPGNFSYQAGGTDENYVYLLFEHIFSAMQFRFRVDDVYAALRKIKLKKLELLAYDNDGHLKKRNVTAQIALKANATGDSPIESVNFIPPEDAWFDMDPVTIFDRTDDPAGQVELPTGVDGNGFYKYSNFFGSFVPKAISRLELISTYDVYDQQGNLVRSNCTAKNNLIISELFDQQEETRRGWKYILNMVVEPTYLYILSEPDLDNPTIRLETTN